MNDTIADNAETPAELPDIDFESPGRFAVHNPQAPQAETPRWEPAPFRLGDSSEPQRFSDLNTLRMHLTALLQQAERSLSIYTPDLQPSLYDHTTVQAALTQLLLTHPRNQVRILVQDSGRAVREGHRLLHLAKRLTSNFHLRKLNPDRPAPETAFVIVDDRGLLSIDLKERFTGVALYHSPSRVRQQQELFERAWEASVTDPDLRSFLI